MRSMEKARGFGTRNPKVVAAAIAGFIAGILTLPNHGEYAKKFMEKLNELADKCPQATMVFFVMVAAKLLMDALLMVYKPVCGRRDDNVMWYQQGVPGRVVSPRDLLVPK